jgi:DNA topoisomerase-1
MSINFDNNFEPIYVITKPDVVKNLRSAMKNVDMLYIASDGDAEGDQIAQTIYDVLKPKNYKRLIFNSITKEAIMNSIKNAGKINENSVAAQKARRVLDRLYGYLISPILQKQIGGKLSAGRVQSVAAKIVIDKENEIKDFINKNAESSYFKVNGIFSLLKSNLFEIKGEIDTDTVYNGKIALIPLLDNNNPNSKVKKFMNRCLESKFIVHSVEDRIATRNPAPPFETCTLQQEANRKFGMSVDTTMKTAQKLYEAGYITYMRTDSIEISPEGHKEIKKIIEQEYGKDYYQKNVYKNKSTSAQEAHEAIRPTHPDLLSVEEEIDDAFQIKLYKLIWQRTIASQMKPAKINITTIQIDISEYVDKSITNPFYYFQSQIEKIIFPGFMKVYIESVDDAEEDDTMKGFDGKIPKLGQKIAMEMITARQEYKKPPPRYSEASLVKILKKLGIGRPSTYVNTIKTIMNRQYVKIDNIAGIKKDIVTFTIKTNKNKSPIKILEEKTFVFLGSEKKKIIPTNLGITVNDFLVEFFPEMMDYKFTAKMETELDAISNGEKIWHVVVKKFYDKLAPIVDDLSKKKGITKADERLLGTDSDGIEIFATKTKHGPAVKKYSGSKYIYASIPEYLSIEKIKLSDAVKLFEYPKNLGLYEKKDVMLHKGKFGFYFVHNKISYSIGSELGSNFDLSEAIKIIEAKKSNIISVLNITENKKKIKATIMNGSYGPYIQVTRANKKTNYSISRNLDPSNLTEKIILEIISKKKTPTKKINTKNFGGSKSAKKKIQKSTKN